MTFGQTCILLDEDTHKDWLSFDAEVLQITTLLTATNANAGEYQLKLSCTLDDQDGAEETSVIHFIVDPSEEIDADADGELQTTDSS